MDDFPFLHRISLWAKRPLQKNSIIFCAFLELHKQNENVHFTELKKLSCRKMSPKQFDTNYTQMKTDKGNPHGRVFYELNGKVYMYDEVKREAEKYFA